MKFSVEIDLDWIDEESNLDDTVQKQIIDNISSITQKKVSSDVESKIQQIIDETTIKRINEKIDDVFADFIGREVSVYDSYGSVTNTYKNVEELIKERFDNFMTQTVDDKGITDSSTYGRNKTTRLVHIVDKQLTEFADKFTADAVSQVSAEIKEHVKEGLTSKLGNELMKVLKVEKMLELPTSR